MPISLDPAGTGHAHDFGVAGFPFLIVGLICAIISRILLFVAALNVSAGWAIGVLLPFGPLLFRLSYPEDAHSSKMFRLATVICLFFYLVLGPGAALPLYHPVNFNPGRATPTESAQYSLEKSPGSKPGSGPKVELSPALEERRVANTREFERLRAWNEALRMKKRDLLHSDTDGNEAYNSEFAQYTAALEKANAERNALWPSVK